MARAPQFLVIDDHEAILAGTLPALQQQYPQASIATAQTERAAERQIVQHNSDFIILDLILPETTSAHATVDTGLRLLHKLMNRKPAPNIMVLSINVMPLIRLKAAINVYEGGFVAIDKSLSLEEMLHFVDMALRGSVYLPTAIRSRPEVDMKWVRVLQLKFHKGLSDVAIAREMGISDRTVRNYWVRIQDMLNVYETPEQDTRAQVQIAARRAGLIN